jgi:hypothetical protein
MVMRALALDGDTLASICRCRPGGSITRGVWLGARVAQHGTPLFALPLISDQEHVTFHLRCFYASLLELHTANSSNRVAGSLTSLRGLETGLQLVQDLQNGVLA